MRVTLIASTFIEPNRDDSGGESSTTEWLDWPDEGVSGCDFLAEFAGRACYQSWDRPNPKTRANKDYLANIIAQGHFSVLEHASATFYVQGVSRALTHELVRHRHLSYSQLSQRYVDASDTTFVYPPAIDEGFDELGAPATDLMWLSKGVVTHAMEVYTLVAEALERNGYTRKQAREAARCVLPNMTETKIVVTGNLRAWRDFLHKRHHVAADAEMQLFAKEVLRHLREIAPHSVQDIPDEPFGTKES